MDVSPAVTGMFAGHNHYLVALSVATAILGGYTGFGLASRVRGTSAAGRRALLAGAATFLALGIWTMHFVGMLAAPIPADAAYLVLPTIVSFLICALVVGVSLFFVSTGDPSQGRVAASALLLGAGVVSMHYVGIHGLTGAFRIEHEGWTVVLAAAIAVGTAYGGLRIFLAGHGGMRLTMSAIAFGLAVAGMHYTATSGMTFVPEPETMRPADGLIASPQVLALVLSLLCFLIAAGFLLSLVPEPRGRVQPSLAGIGEDNVAHRPAGEYLPKHAPAAAAPEAQRPLPLGGLGQPRIMPATRLPVEGANATHLMDAAEVRSIRADAHYTQVHDGSRERMCAWSISQAETHLDPAVFMRVHRSHIVAIPHVTMIRKEGDGAVVELNGSTRHLVPVSRARIAELRARLGLLSRHGGPLPREGQSA